jgi:GNAT superfamily N-acetyltransferase
VRIDLLQQGDLEAYVAHARRADAEASADALPTGPRDGEPRTEQQIRRRAAALWTRTLESPGWRRVFGVWEGAALVGSLTLTAGDLAASRHRVGLGMGVERAYRRRGHGRALLEAAIDWCCQCSQVAWIDLGVFAGHDGAASLYRSVGFVQTAHIRDRFRIGDKSVDDVQMTLLARRVTHIVVHRVEVSQEDATYQDTAADTARFFREHPLGQKVTGGAMPYHVLIDPSGETHHTVPLDRAAPHAANANATSVGVACIGDFRAAPPPAAQYQALVACLADLGRILGLDALSIVAHDALPGASRDPEKVCPGVHLPLDRLRDDVARMHARPSAAWGAPAGAAPHWNA